MKKILIALSAIASLGLYSCNPKASTRNSFLDIKDIDSSINPADDFFAYMNGKWIKKTQIPGDNTGWGSFYTLDEENVAKTKLVLEEAAANTGAKGSVKQKVGDFYKSGLDTATIEALGATPIKADLAAIEGMKTIQDYWNYITTNKDNYGGRMFSFSVSADDKNSNKNIVCFYQGGTGLPEKDYYFKKDSATLKIKDAYLKYIATFKLIGNDSATAATKAADIYAFETKLAVAHQSPVEQRDVQKNYHKYAVPELKNVIDINWQDFLTKVGMPTDSVLMYQPAYYSALGQLLKTVDINTLKNIETFSIINQAAPHLSKAFVDASFNYNQKTLNGTEAQSARWKKVAGQVDGYIGELLGQLWTEKYFTKEAKEKMLALVQNLQKVYRSRIEKLDWMSAATKAKALVKMDKIINKIGYPDKWKEYADVSIDAKDYYGNIKSASRHAYKKMCDDLKKPVDKTEWGMTPPTVNAYANPVYNEIVFPAGILQFPFFDPAADDAINYGGIGMVIGHEMTHLFDDQGRLYDDNGNMADWWTKEDADKFVNKSKGVVDQYNAYTMFGNMHVNGELTLGENLADIGGIAIAYQAFKLTKQGQDSTKIDGLTPDQRFFMSFAQIWRIKNRDETMKLRLTTDPHSPEQFRINGPLSGFEPFYKAFNVQPNNKMYLPVEKRVNIW
jgi:putative endopeptidase